MSDETQRPVITPADSPPSRRSDELFERADELIAETVRQSEEFRR